MPFADQAMLGPNRIAAFAYGYGLFALPNALIISAILFALATATRSTAGTFFGVVGLLVLYLVSQRLMESEPQLQTFRVLADPFGMSAYMAASRYFTAAELNAGAVPVTALMLLEQAALGRRVARLAGADLSAVPLLGPRPVAATAAQARGGRRRWLRPRPMPFPARASPGWRNPASTAAPLLPQFAARAGMEARFILGSPAFLILLLIAFAFTLPSLLTASGWMDVPLYPLTSVLVPIVEASFDPLLLVVATYYGGELVWRERERKLNEIIDATPLPSWALMLPKMLGLALVLVATLLVGMGVGMLVQLLEGGAALGAKRISALVSAAGRAWTPS